MQANNFAGVEEFDQGQDSNEDLISGRVHQIRRQWAVHEDEAFAYRLQNEEISQHYCGNRTRNAIVREDVPRAREEQKKEEKVALEERFHQLYLLQQQADEDERLAKELAGRFELGLEAGSLLPPPSLIPPPPNFGLNNNHNVKSPGPCPPQGSPKQQQQQQPPLKSDQRILNDISEPLPSCSSSSSSKNSHNFELRKMQNTNLVKTTPPPLTSPSGSSTSNGSGNDKNSSKKTKSIIKMTSAYDGAGSSGMSNRNGNNNRIMSVSPSASASSSTASSSSSPPLLAAAGTSVDDDEEFDIDFDILDVPPHLLHAHEERLLQLKMDEVVALKLQEELEKEEIDKRLAVEAQDRELAKVLHQKEKERLRRAKERAKQKHALAAAEGIREPRDELDNATIFGNVNARLSPRGDEVSSHANMSSSRTPSRSSVGSGGSSSAPNDVKSPSRTSNSNGSSGHHPGPRVPEKTGSGSGKLRDDPIGIIGFRAAPKALPPQPQVADPHHPHHRRTFVQGIGVGAGGGSNKSSSGNVSSSRYENYRLPQEPIPPYMPLQGLQNYSKKKSK